MDGQIGESVWPSKHVSFLIVKQERFLRACVSERFSIRRDRIVVCFVVVLIGVACVGRTKMAVAAVLLATKSQKRG